jgi:hypothetical protein
VDAGSVLGVQYLRASFLDDVSAAEPRQAQTRDARTTLVMTFGYVLDDPDDDLDDEDDDLDDEDDDEDDDDEDDEDEEEEETWQVVEAEGRPLKVGLFLTSGDKLPRLAKISSSTELETDSAGYASRRRRVV